MAVADVFTALTENRPYRKGMSADEALKVLWRLVGSGGLDGEVVNKLQRDFDAVNTLKMEEQAHYAETQRRIGELVHPAAAGDLLCAGTSAH
jgi:HD-GYP domain-containing protein (c-di-GMP phosphodiesterase class II)